MSTSYQTGIAEIPLKIRFLPKCTEIPKGTRFTSGQWLRLEKFRLVQFVELLPRGLYHVRDKDRCWNVRLRELEFAAPLKGEKWEKRLCGKPHKGIWHPAIQRCSVDADGPWGMGYRDMVICGCLLPIAFGDREQSSGTHFYRVNEFSCSEGVELKHPQEQKPPKGPSPVAPRSQA